VTPLRRGVLTRQRGAGLTNVKDETAMAGTGYPWAFWELNMRNRATLTRIETGFFVACALLMASGLVMVGIR
jgi:hypothetical protein